MKIIEKSHNIKTQNLIRIQCRIHPIPKLKTVICIGPNHLIKCVMLIFLIKSHKVYFMKTRLKITFSFICSYVFIYLNILPMIFNCQLYKAVLNRWAHQFQTHHLKRNLTFTLGF